MRKFTFIVLALSLPLLAQADGMGVTVPFDITQTERINYSNVDMPQATYKYKPSTGIGFVFDSNIGKNSDFSYRLNFEYTQADIDESSRLYSSSFAKHKYNIVNTFGLSVYHSRYIRLWAGPRLNFQYEHISSSSNIQRQSSFGIGLGLATGLNVHLGPKVSLALDVDYHATAMLGWEYYKSYDGTTTGDTTNYTGLAGNNRGVTARLYFLLRFGEQYESTLHKSREDSVIDYSL